MTKRSAAHGHHSPHPVSGGPVVKLPTAFGEFVGQAWIDEETGVEHFAVSSPESPADGVAPLVRLHSECLTGDIFGSYRCDCGEQLAYALGLIRENLLSRVDETDQALRDGRPESSPLTQLEAQFDGLEQNVRAVGAPDQQTVRHIDAVAQASDRMKIAADTALAREGTSDEQAAVDAYEHSVDVFADAVRRFGNAQNSTVVDARSAAKKTAPAKAKRKARPKRARGAAKPKIARRRGRKSRKRK